MIGIGQRKADRTLSVGDAGGNRPTWNRALLSAVPLLLFGSISFAVRLHMASLLELDHHVATAHASVRAAGLGAVRDVAWLIPAYLLWSAFARRPTRWLVHLAFAVAGSIVAVDLVYFYVTFEHIEPVLFVNVNALSVRGSMSADVLTRAAVVALGLGALVYLNDRALKSASRSPRAASISVAAAMVLIGSIPLYAPPQIRVADGDRSLEEFLNRSRNRYLDRVSVGIIDNLFASIRAGGEIEAETPKIPYQPYTDEEQGILSGLGLAHRRDGRSIDRPAAHRGGTDAGIAEVARTPILDSGISRIVLLVLESLPAAYLHHYNEGVPAEATPFLDSLLEQHPHFDRFYTSNMPSDWGLNSLLLSRLRPEWSGGNPSVLSELRDARGFESFYVRGVSKHYGNELATYPRLFQMDHYIAFEELSERYDEPWRSAWGFNNEVVYAEGLRILRENRDRNVMVVLKTIDLHQPGPFEGVPEKYLPPALRRNRVGLHNALHWADRCVKRLFDALDAEGLYDEKTLVVVTSDHSPHPGVAYKQTVPADEYERLGRLPLIFATRNSRVVEALETDGFASQIDLAPTLLALVGLDAPSSFQGRALLGEREPAGAPADRYRVGVYRDTFYYDSDAESFSEEIGADDPVGSPRNRAIRKWLANLDAAAPREASRIAASR